MKLNDINIRDPYILNYNGAYYMYGTRDTQWTSGATVHDFGFDVYVSSDLEEWTGPKSVSSGDLISGCDHPGRCQPSRIPGRCG